MDVNAKKVYQNKGVFGDVVEVVFILVIEDAKRLEGLNFIFFTLGHDRVNAEENIVITYLHVKIFIVKNVKDDIEDEVDENFENVPVGFLDFFI